MKKIFLLVALCFLAGCFTAAIKPEKDYSLQTKMVINSSYVDVWNKIIDNLAKNDIEVISSDSDAGRIVVKNQVLIQPKLEIVEEFASCGRYDWGFIGMVKISREIQLTDMQNGLQKVDVLSNIVAQPVSWTGINRMTTCYSKGIAEKELLSIATKGL